ncbi:hypothetical protein RND81_03G196300 [Saponaria officinalis]|uniref:Carotenoid cleavage dioxygenase 7 n=1 Tax=Saponaria officinalis TaxID=3572 RepID=A0AAW1M9W3_SAPOF
MQAKYHNLISPVNFGRYKNLRPPKSAQIRPSTVLTRPVSNPTVITQSMATEVNSEEVAFWDYQFLFMSQRLEVPKPIKLKLVHGALPKDFPCGTYYLIGPGLFIDDYGSSINPLDGHGYLRAFEIEGLSGEVKFCAKYVKTEAQIEECDPKYGSWKFTHRGPFSVLKGGKMIANTKVMKNVANTSILKWGKRLFCLWEGGLPYEIDPRTLDTIGKFDLISFGGGGNEVVSSLNRCCIWDVVALLLKPILFGVFKMPPKRLLSHYKIDAKRRRLIVMTCNAEDMVLPISHCTFYEFDETFKLLNERAFQLSTHTMIHDWGFTDTHYILFANPIKLDILGSMEAICGTRPMISTLSIDHRKQTSPIYLLPRFLESKVSSNSNDYLGKPIEIPQIWLLHVANAYEEIDNDGNLLLRVHASTCSYKWLNFQNMFGYNWQSDILKPSIMNCLQEKNELSPNMVEVSIKIQNNGGYRECTIQNLNNRSKSSDFPIINPQLSGYKHRYVYAATCSGSRHTLPHFPFDAIVKFDTLNKSSRTWFCGNRRFVGEPMFVSRDHQLSEDNGYLLVIEYEVSHRLCNLLILDAKRVGEASALVARFEVPKSLTFPLGFHGTWTLKD